MHDLNPAISAGTDPDTRRSALRITARWMLSFLGFPLGGFTTMLVVGPVNTPITAVIGGAITGAILGAAQSWGLGRVGPPLGWWIAATGIGLSAGLAIGSAVVDYRTDLPALLVQGAISGFAVGAAQALLLRRFGPLAAVWPAVLAVVWPLGWFITTSAGVVVDNQFSVFGSLGAVAVTAITAVLPLALSRRTANAS